VQSDVSFGFSLKFSLSLVLSVHGANPIGHQRPVFIAAAAPEARWCPRDRNEIKKRTWHWQPSPAAEINTMLCTGRQVNRYCQRT